MPFSRSKSSHRRMDGMKKKIWRMERGLVIVFHSFTPDDPTWNRGFHLTLGGI